MAKKKPEIIDCTNPNCQCFECCGVIDPYEDRRVRITEI